MVDYERYIQSLQWYRTRKLVLAATGRRCNVCGDAGGQLDVHHNTYERLGRELARDLIVLCRECHTLFHKHGRLQRPPKSREVDGRPLEMEAVLADVS